ncbi:MAG: N-acetylmuramoyl-L-alanine amidase [Thermoanaerobaculia bacterium]
MKRLLSLGVLVLLAVATIVVAQTAGTQSFGQATLRTTTGDRPFTYVVQSGQTYVAAAEVAQGLGGSVESDSNGYKVTINGAVAAFGPDSRYGVIRDDLIEMPVPPIAIEGRPYVPWQFFQGFLGKSNLDVAWDANAKVLTIRPQQRDAVGVQVSVANVQGTTKIVMTLSASAEYGVVKEPSAYVVRFKSPVRPPFGEQAYEDPYLAKVTFIANEMRIQLTAPDVVGDAYQLENPPRIVLDLRKGSGPAPGALPPSGTPPRLQEAPGIHTIVIDPGHGGKEVGAVGPAGIYEKDITLAVSQKLAASLAAKTGARVVLTREDDSIVSLDQRTAIANQYKADLFLSVHMNASVAPHAKGSETYYLSLEASDELAKKAAETENAAAASDPASDLKLILWDLAQQAYIGESSRFAQAIQEEMSSATGVANRGVKQAPFKVLVGATMPAALVEVGFISNPEEEEKLQSAAFQSSIVDAITRAVVRYKSDYETRIGVAPPPAAPATATAPATSTQPPAATSAQPAPVNPQTRTER